MNPEVSIDTSTPAAGVHAGLSFSLNYAAPELIAAQALGSRTFLSDPSADVWALGVTGFELLLGQRAFPTGPLPLLPFYIRSHPPDACGYSPFLLCAPAAGTTTNIRAQYIYVSAIWDHALKPTCSS